MSAVIEEVTDETFENDKAAFDAEFDRPVDEEEPHLHSHWPECIDESRCNH